MATLIDPTAKRLILDKVSLTAQELYRAWVDWAVQGDNLKWLPAFRTAGGDDLGGGRAIPGYYFLSNGWRVRPMEADHTLTIDGNLFVDGGGSPIVRTLGDWNVLANLVVPVQAQGIYLAGGGGSGSAATPEQIAAQVRLELSAELAAILQTQTRVDATL